MHIIIGLLGSIVTILYLLNRINNLGIDFGWLNPFHWRRRRAWSKKYEGDPIHSVDDPMHIAAILIIGAAKLDGELSAEQKQTAIDQFTARFSMDSNEASDLYTAASHLLGAPQVIEVQLEGVAKRNEARLSTGQAESMLEMMFDVATTDGVLSEKQQAFIENLRAQFIPAQDDTDSWS